MTSTRLESGRRAGGGAKCHGLVICLQLRYGTLTARVRHVRPGGRGRGVKSLSLAVTDGFCHGFPSEFPSRD